MMPRSATRRSDARPRRARRWGGFPVRRFRPRPEFGKGSPEGLRYAGARSRSSEGCAPLAPVAQGFSPARQDPAFIRRLKAAISLMFRTSRYPSRSEEHTSELQSQLHLVCRLLLEKKNPENTDPHHLAVLPHDPTIQHLASQLRYASASHLPTLSTLHALSPLASTHALVSFPVPPL